MVREGGAEGRPLQLAKLVLQAQKTAAKLAGPPETPPGFWEWVGAHLHGGNVTIVGGTSQGSGTGGQVVITGGSPGS